MEVTLAESPHFALVHEHESVFVIDRRTGARHDAGDHYGDPSCGLIAPDETWIASGGEGIVVWRDGRIDEFLRRGHLPEGLDLGPGEFVAVSDMRLEPPSAIRILIDPWSRLASVWVLDPIGGVLAKLHDGPDLRDEPFRERIDW